VEPPCFTQLLSINHCISEDGELSGVVKVVEAVAVAVHELCTLAPRTKQTDVCEPVQRYHIKVEVVFLCI